MNSPASPGKRRLREPAGGQIAVMLALLLPVLLGLVGLVVDGGLMLVHFRRGQVTIDSAALAAAARLDEALFAETNQVQLYTADAYSQAMLYAHLNGRGRVAVTSVSIDGPRVRVIGRVSSPTIFMRLFGINQVHIRLHASAEIKHGITQEGQ